MTTESANTVMTVLDAVAAAAVGALTSSEPLVVADVVHEITEIDLPTAVVVSFDGRVSGELALLIDAELAAALRDSEIGNLDLAAALAPALDAIADAIGGVALSVPQELDARLSLHRVAARGDSGLATLRGASVVRAAIALGIDPPQGGQEISPTGPAFDRLDLLRGVEMQASAELGRARMTVNDLLSLRNGAVIELDRAAGEPADLFINGRLIARGEVVVVEENYALRITSIVTEDNRR